MLITYFSGKRAYSYTCLLLAAAFRAFPVIIPETLTKIGGVFKSHCFRNHMDLHFRCEQQLSGPLQPVIINELDEITSRFLLKNGTEVIRAYVKGCGDIVQGEGTRIVLVNVLLYFSILRLSLSDASETEVSCSIRVRAISMSCVMLEEV